MEQGTIPKSKLFSFQIETEFSDKKSGIFEAVRASGNVLCVCARACVFVYVYVCVVQSHNQRTGIHTSSTPLSIIIMYYIFDGVLYLPLLFNIVAMIISFYTFRRIKM